MENEIGSILRQKLEDCDRYQRSQQQTQEHSGTDFIWPTAYDRDEAPGLEYGVAGPYVGPRFLD